MKTRPLFQSLACSLVLLAPVISQAALGTNTDLAIGKTASLNSVSVGGALSFQLAVTNLGPAPASERPRLGSVAGRLSVCFVRRTGNL